MMKNLDEIQKILAMHRHDLHSRFHVERIGVFGSYSRGDMSPQSDVDILVEFDHPVGWEIVEVRDYLQELLAVKVDLITKAAVSKRPLLWMSILEDLVYV